MTLKVNAELQATLSGWLEACRNKDVAQIMTHYAEEVVAYDAVGPLRFVGRAAYQAHWQACMDMCVGATLFEAHEPNLILADELAVVHSLLQCGGTDEDGQLQSSWMRMTQCLRYQGGRWLIVHEHFSMPCDMETGKTHFDLQP